MKIIFVVSALVAYTAGLSVLDQEWEQFKTNFNKEYSNDAEEDRRYKIFLANKALIAEHNLKFENGEATFTMGINHLTDLLPEETVWLRGYQQSPFRNTNDTVFKPEEGASYPETVDWRDEGYVTPVKDQGDCGSCWAFSATGSLEGQNFAKTGILVDLSEQNLVDCVPGDNCYGGRMNDAFIYVKLNKGIDTEESYPYKAENGRFCRYDAANKGGTCSGHENIASGSEDDLLAATATVGPISVAIDAYHSSFQHYRRGIYFEPDCSSIHTNHAVLVVGYGTENGVDYWLVKNSWGTRWGQRGYIQMSRNKNNNCGIATNASFPYA